MGCPEAENTGNHRWWQTRARQQVVWCGAGVSTGEAVVACEKAGNPKWKRTVGVCGEQGRQVVWW